MRFINGDKEKVARIFLNHIDSGYTVTFLSPFKNAYNKVSSSAVYPSRELAEKQIGELKNEFSNYPNINIEIEERISGTNSRWKTIKVTRV